MPADQDPHCFNSLPLGKFFVFTCCLCIFFQNQLFQKILSGIPPECQTDWIQIRPDILSSVIWVQTVCKSYQQTTLGDKELIENLVFSAVTFCLFFPVDSILDHIPRPQMLLVIIIQLSMTILFCICFL